jgi:hypothetical protein
MWRPDIGKYTGHMQRPAQPGDEKHVIPDAVSNVIPQFAPVTARLLGPGLRNWQSDPFNQDTTYFTSFDTVSCTSALTNAVGAAWATKPGPATGPLGISVPVLEGVANTNQIMSTDCGDRCAWLSKDMQATALVGAPPLVRPGWETLACRLHLARAAAPPAKLSPNPTHPPPPHPTPPHPTPTPPAPGRGVWL